MKNIIRAALLIPCMLTAVPRKTKYSRPVRTMSVSCIQIGQQAPAFKARTTKGVINFPKDFAGKWVIFFSHPADFTPVCKTEFKRLAKLTKEFDELNAQFVGLSVDTEYVHKIWEQSLESELEKETKQKRKINFPVVADPNKAIANRYGMIHPQESTTQTVRSVFFIDPKGKIRAAFYYPISNGRNFKEVKRLLQALQITDKEDVATPEGWEAGKPTIAKKRIAKDILPES